MSRLRHIVVVLLTMLSCTAMAQMNTDRLTAIGRNALYFDDYVLSIQYFNQVIKLKPYLAEPYLYRAIAKIQLGDLQGAERDCSLCIDNSPFLPGAYYTRGFVYRGMKDYEKAERDFTEALVFSPDNRTYLLLRADVRALREDYDGALADIDYILRREPESSSIHFERGIIMMQRRDTLEALRSFSSAVQYDGQNAANWSARGVTNSMLGHEDEALLDLSTAINLGSRWPGDYINRGILYYRQHNYRGAMADYDQAIQLDPNDGHSYYNRGLLRQELGDYNNAILDYDQALSLDPSNTEVHYQRGVVNLQLRQWKAALADFDSLIAAYPYFLPSYYLAAQAKTAMGDSKGAFIYRQKATDLENQKDQLAAKQQVNTGTQTAQAQPQKRDRRKEFSNRAAQNQQGTDDDERYQSGSRGAVQRRYADVVNQPNIVLSYYAQQDPLRRTSYYHYVVDEFNRSHTLPSALRFTAQEVALTAEMVNRHFDQISQLSARIERLDPSLFTSPSSSTSTSLPLREGPGGSSSAAALYFSRAVEFALVQDYSSAIEDCNKALYLDATVVGYFCRANWRYKHLEYMRMSGEEINPEYLKLEFEMILRDYDQVILKQPDFSFAYYNKANILCTQRDFAAAIQYYTAAISADPDFAEAYFNRGLTYIYTDDGSSPAPSSSSSPAPSSSSAASPLSLGLSDLSKAGELGIYQSYNLISRFRE